MGIADDIQRQQAAMAKRFAPPEMPDFDLDWDEVNENKARPITTRLDRIIELLEQQANGAATE